MDEIRIPNDATYAPVALTDLIAAAPIASGLLLGATLPGRVLSAAAFGMYAGSAVKDWLARQDMRWIDFVVEFGADVHWLDDMPEAERRAEVDLLARRVSEGWTDERLPRAELARKVNGHLTDFIASITGQRVKTSSEVRDFGLAQLVFPFAMGACDVISGDVSIFRDTGLFEAHVICHEFVHRKGYWKELHAQVLSYFALMGSGHPVLVQAALGERLHRQLKVLAGENPEAYHDLVEGLDARTELKQEMHLLRPDPSAYESVVSSVMRRLYDERLKLTGQNGISDYDLGFTNFLWTFAHSEDARQDAALADV
jgi:Protein of unknown function (DUF3810)